VSQAGEAGEGGAAPMGMAGAGDMGGMGGDPNGEAGQAGAAPVATFEENCATVCAAQAALDCSLAANCVSDCTGHLDPDFGTDVPDEYRAMIACQAQKLTAANYLCVDQGPPANQKLPFAAAATACEASICKYTCDDMSGLIDTAAHDRCCPP